MSVESIGSVLPMQIVDDDDRVVEEIICDSIAGGAQEINRMPRRLSLMRFKDGVRIGWAEYEFKHLIDETTEVKSNDR